MKLRNKKTGEVERMWKDNICLAFGDCNKVYHSLAELNEEWEDYKPAEPLIKDEKIRKAIRAWANENDTTRVVYYSPKNELVDSYGNIISFNLILRELKHCAEYTIAELCGESKEDDDEA